MKIRMMKWLAVALLLGGSGVAVEAASSSGPGIAIGAKAPAFSLFDQSGKERSLGTFLGQQKKVALVFYRSADW